MFFFQLHSNPWNCDCHLKNFRDWVVFRGLYTYPTSCAEPERLADKLWQDVDPKDFACKPEIRIPQDVVFSQPGANVTLSCFIIGNPMPDAKWVLKVILSYFAVLLQYFCSTFAVLCRVLSLAIGSKTSTLQISFVCFHMWRRLISLILA